MCSCLKHSMWTSHTKEQFGEKKDGHLRSHDSLAIYYFHVSAYTSPRVLSTSSQTTQLSSSMPKTASEKTPNKCPQQSTPSTRKTSRKSPTPEPSSMPKARKGRGTPKTLPCVSSPLPIPYLCLSFLTCTIPSSKKPVRLVLDHVEVPPSKSANRSNMFDTLMNEFRYGPLHFILLSLYLTFP